MSEDNDHDVLTRIDVNLSSFMDRFKEHEVKDDKRFGYLEKIAYGGLGIVVFIQLITPFLQSKIGG